MQSVKCILGSPRPFFCCLYATFASIPLLSQHSRLWRTQTWGWVLILTFTQVISFQQTPVLLSVKWGYNCLLHKVPARIKWRKTHTALEELLSCWNLLSLQTWGFTVKDRGFWWGLKKSNHNSIALCCFPSRIPFYVQCTYAKPLLDFKT